MQKDFARTDRGFYHLAEAYYGKTLPRPGYVDEVMIGIYPDGGTQGTCGEFAVRWIDLCGKNVPQLQVFDDSWAVLHHFSDLLAKMAEIDGENISPTEFCALLKSLDCNDYTPRQRK